jgi:protein phosphatase
MTSSSSANPPHPRFHFEDAGPFDIVGDVHGCHGELIELLERLGYRIDGTPESPRVEAPPGRRVLFLGDLVDRGPGIPACLRLALAMTRAGTAMCVLGNHDRKLGRWLEGRDVEVAFGLAQSIEQMQAEPQDFKDQVRLYIDELPHHLVLDHGKLVVAHAGLREELHGQDSKRAWSYSIFSETTGERDENGYPVRKDWAAEYSGAARVVYGHTVVPQAVWRNETICLDTGCVYGDRLTALRYPELELVEVAAHAVHYDEYP